MLENGKKEDIGAHAKSNEAQPNVSSEAKGAQRIRMARPGTAEQQPRAAQSKNIFAQHVARKKPLFAKEIPSSCIAKNFSKAKPKTHSSYSISR